MSRSFDRVDDYISIGTMGNFGTGLDNNFLVFSTWLKSSDTTHVMCIMGTFNTGTVTGWQFFLNTNDNSTVGAGKIFYFRRDEGTLLNSGKVDYNTGITDGNWHHLVIAISNNAHKIWIDGVSQTITETFNQNPTNMANFGFAMTLGARNNRNTIDNFYSGLMAHVSLDSVSTNYTDGKVKQIMRYPGSIPVNGGYLPFWGGSPEGDYSGNGNNGTVTGATVSTDNPPINGIFYPRVFRNEYAITTPAAGGGWPFTNTARHVMLDRWRRVA